MRKRTGSQRPEARRRIAEELVDRLAEIHAVNPNGLRLSDFGPEEFVDRQIYRWYKQFEWAFDVMGRGTRDYFPISVKRLAR
jgi:aminoglycoside phosphotransferase (APT) family kinase protein